MEKMIEAVANCATGIDISRLMAESPSAILWVEGKEAALHGLRKKDGSPVECCIPVHAGIAREATISLQEIEDNIWAIPRA